MKNRIETFLKGNGFEGISDITSNNQIFQHNETRVIVNIENF